ncbi:putative ABC transport system ATP-binding protein [Phycicoccus badiiscoriae]|uniref:Putative ABC transport system ATP-binding protein n=1 Tax=Pedococcus badiiscoriae TaxID=642776 RepID=A0A852WID1_9MICO|nr:ABC transporter ATP-binding protein [Pedococcus badiiscoriae]NYG07341.1 putative ABC transport system ATP-binding protein [Pedococcus badiiscoriae]
MASATTVTARPQGLAPEGQPALVADRLYRFYRAGDDETLALQGVSLTLQPGEMLAVVGPSGSGKSTLLSCLAGLDEPAGGTVTIAGHRLSHQPEPVRAGLRAKHIGILLQSRNLLPHLNLTANISLVQSALRRSHPRPAALDLLESVGLADRAQSLPRQLSGGELARAGLAVALANDAQVILADEPTGELDGETEQQVLDLLRQRVAAGTALLVVTHSAEVMAAADRVITLADGKVQA